MELVIAYITAPTKDEARKIAIHLLERRLVACANILSMQSIYWWEERLNEGEEWLLLAKTSEEMFPKVVEEVEKIHPYEVPCIIKLNANANKGYLDWVRGTL